LTAIVLSTYYIVFDEFYACSSRNTTLSTYLAICA
jgi:hypothetical protein